MWEKIASLTVGELTIIGVCIIAINLLLVIGITILVNKRAKESQVIKERTPKTASQVYYGASVPTTAVRGALNVFGYREGATDYQYGANWVNADIESGSYKGSVPPVGILKGMLDFGDGEEIRTVYGEYDTTSFIDGSTYGGKRFRAKPVKRIEKRIPMGIAEGKKVILGTIVAKYH
ncbi:MAG: hypothetical protein IJD50_07150 [Clostridia bacterium]|nr:hypothetical protein [Clostridia bacterium]